jgi:xanthine/uracil permease
MAGALTLAGLTLLTLRDRFSWLARLLTRVPNATGSLVLIVGAALAARAALTL